MDNRKSTRKKAAAVGLLDVFRFDSSGGRKRLGPSLLMDISDGGIAVQVDGPVAAGEVLLLQNKIFERYAIVRNCRVVAPGFQLGMQYCSAPSGNRVPRR